jgi:hypothetical protein
MIPDGVNGRSRELVEVRGPFAHDVGSDAIHAGKNAVQRVLATE